MASDFSLTVCCFKELENWEERKDKSHKRLHSLPESIVLSSNFYCCCKLPSLKVTEGSHDRNSRQGPGKGTAAEAMEEATYWFTPQPALLYSSGACAQGSNHP